MIAIGCVHGGFNLKKEIIDFLEENNYSKIMDGSKILQIHQIWPTQLKDFGE